MSATEPRWTLGKPFTADYSVGLAQWPHGEAHPDGCVFINIPDRFLKLEDPNIMDLKMKRIRRTQSTMKPQRKTTTRAKRLYHHNVEGVETRIC